MRIAGSVSCNLRLGQGAGDKEHTAVDVATSPYRLSVTVVGYLVRVAFSLL